MVIQYIDLYVSTILRLLVMSVIISGTPNYLRYIKTHKLIIPIVGVKTGGSRVGGPKLCV